MCVHCDELFDHQSHKKMKAGGKINECPTCVEEMGLSGPTKYLALQAGDGKMSGITILQFETDDDREKYAKMWRNNSGQNKGKSCQLGTHLTASGGIKFKTIQTTEPVNHKGKMT